MISVCLRLICIIYSYTWFNKRKTTFWLVVYSHVSVYEISCIYVYIWEHIYNYSVSYEDKKKLPAAPSPTLAIVITYHTDSSLFWCGQGFQGRGWYRAHGWFKSFKKSSIMTHVWALICLVDLFLVSHTGEAWCSTNEICLLSYFTTMGRFKTNTLRRLTSIMPVVLSKKKEKKVSC